MKTPQYLDRMLDPITACFTPEVSQRLSKISMDREVQDHIDDLARRNTEGELSDEERAELETYVRVGNFIAILLAKARKQETQP